jgi:hypothetical protein
MVSMLYDGGPRPRLDYMITRGEAAGISFCSITMKGESYEKDRIAGCAPNHLYLLEH